MIKNMKTNDVFSLRSKPSGYLLTTHDVHCCFLLQGRMQHIPGITTSVNLNYPAWKYTSSLSKDNPCTEGKQLKEIQLYFQTDVKYRGKLLLFLLVLFGLVARVFVATVCKSQMWEEEQRWHKGKQERRSLWRFICGTLRFQITGALSSRLAHNHPRSRKQRKSPGEAVHISILLPHPCYLLLLVCLLKHPQAKPWRGQLLKPNLP